MHSKQQQQQQQSFNLSPFHPTTNNDHSNNQTPTMTRTRHTSSPASLLLEDAHLRRHSIAIAPTNHNQQQQQQQHQHTRRDSVSYPSSTTSSTCSSPRHETRYDNYSTPPPTSLNGTSSTTTSYSTINNSGSIMSSPPSRRFSTQAPYSRSPELRVSHKLAERKRRKEMKDLFDDLRDLLPVDKGLKTSKWEILSKAVGYISHLHEREENFVKETEQLKRELMYLKRQ
ncbi:unnamed protein product [Absidia cylindrospora]